MLHYARLERLATYKPSSLMLPFVSGNDNLAKWQVAEWPIKIIFGSPKRLSAFSEKAKHIDKMTVLQKHLAPTIFSTKTKISCWQNYNLAKWQVAERPSTITSPKSNISCWQNDNLAEWQVAEWPSTIIFGSPKNFHHRRKKVIEMKRKWQFGKMTGGWMT